jgi:ankyrin repeat protein
MNLLAKGWRWRGRYKHNRTLLHHTAVRGQDRCVSIILKLARYAAKKDASAVDDFINLQDDRNWTALHYAAAGGFTGTAKKLLDAGACPLKVDANGKTAFDIAKEGDFAPVVLWMDRKSPFPTESMADIFRWNDLHCAARCDDILAFEAAVENSVDLSPKDRFGRTPLHLAIETGNRKSVDFLARVSAPSEDDLWQLAQFAIKRDQPEMGRLLLEMLPTGGAQSATSREVSQELLFWAARSGNLFIAERLCQVGVALGEYTLDGTNTPLHIVCARGDVALAELLIAHGASLSKPNKMCRAPLHEAIIQATEKEPPSSGELVALLVSKGADVNQFMKQLYVPNTCTYGVPELTPLHCALTYGHFGPNLEILHILLRNGADINLESVDHKTALWIVQRALFEAPFARDNSAWNEKRRAQALETAAVFRQYHPNIVLDVLGNCRTVFHQAAFDGDVKTVRMMLENGVPVDSRSLDKDHRNTALFYAVEQGQVEIVRALLEFGADTYSACIGRDKNVLLEVARSRHDGQVADILLRAQKTT